MNDIHIIGALSAFAITAITSKLACQALRKKGYNAVLDNMGTRLHHWRLRSLKLWCLILKSKSSNKP